MGDNNDGDALVAARRRFQRTQLEFNIEETALRIMELQDQIARYEENIAQTKVALAELDKDPSDG